MLRISDTALKKLFYILTILSLILTPFYAQPSITWSRLYDSPFQEHNYGYEVCRSTFNTYFIVGWGNTSFDHGIYIIRINTFGDTIWTKVISSVYSFSEAYAAASSGDGGCVLTGHWQDSSFAIKIDSNGSIVWQKFYNYVIAGGYDIKKSKNNGYIICGDWQYLSSFIMKIDSLGNLIWQKIYSAGFNLTVYSIIEDASENVVAVGDLRENELDTLKGVVIKLDKNGNLIWQKDYKLLNRGAKFKKIDTLYNSYLIGGAIGGSPINTVSFAKLDTSGAVKSVKVFENNFDDIIQDLNVKNHNSYIFAVDRLVSDSLYAHVFITDSLGNIMKQGSFPAHRRSIFYSILPLENGDILFSGFARTYVSYNNDDAFVVRTDSNLYAPPVVIKKISSKIPARFILYQNYPNPFNPVTKIKFSIPPLRGARGMTAKIVIYDILGREIAVLVNEHLKTGMYEAEWNASNYPSGVYFYRLSAGEYTESKKMVLMK